MQLKSLILLAVSATVSVAAPPEKRIVVSYVPDCSIRHR